MPPRMTMHRTVALALLSAAVSAPAAAATEEELLKKIANAIYTADNYKKPREKRDVTTLRKAAADCLTGIDDAIALGVGLDAMVEMPGSNFPEARKIERNGYPIWASPMSAARELCKAYAVIPDLAELELALQMSDIWLGKAPAIAERAAGKKGFDDEALAEADQMTLEAARCTETVDAALARGVPADAPIKLSRLGATTVGALGADLCAALAAAGEAIRAVEDRKLEARIAPYREALAGDKLATFLDRHMYFHTIYGKGGVELDTPAKLAKASAWFEVLTWQDDLGLTNWTVRKYTFKKNKLKSVRDKNGCCDWPSSKRFR
jgi:hypothetical protein